MNNNNNNSDPFWYEDVSILWNKNRLIAFFPNTNMTLYEKMNSLVRLSFYIVLLLLVFFGNYLSLYIAILILIFTFLIYRTNNTVSNKSNKKIENFISKQNFDSPQQINFKNIDSLKNVTNTDILNNACTLPSVNNPFMNINQITSKRNRPKACPYYDNEKISNDINEKFDYNLYKDVSNLYNKGNSQRQYYTTPVTTIPNDQTSFAKWCFLSPPTCKEESIRCVPYTTQPPLPEKGLESLQLKYP